MLALARLPVARLLRTPRAWLPIASWASLAVVSAFLARSRSSGNGSDHVMRGAFGYVVLPLVTYAIVSGALGGNGLRRAVRGLVSLGAAPRAAALVTTLVAVVVSALTSALLALVVCAIAHGPSDPPLGLDLAASAGVSALGGATYAAFFSAGSAIGKGAMRGGFLALDFVLGAGAGTGALLTPRAHVTALFGGPLVMDMSARASSFALVVLLVGFGGLAVTLAKRA